MVFDLPFHDYSEIEPIQYPFLHDGEGTGDDLEDSNKKLNFASIENENSDTNNSYHKSSEVIENESPLEKMLTALTGKNKWQRSTKDKAVKFPLKLMYVWTCGDYDHIVHWKVNQIDGSDVFVIDDIDAFTNEVLPSLFKVAKFVSFQRKMYRWGILKSYRSRSEKKKGSVSYSHPLFKKGDFFSAAQMTCSGSEVESQKTASKQKKKVQRQQAQSKSSSKQTRKTSINRNIQVSSNIAREAHKDDPEDLNLFVYSPKDGLMTSMRVSSLLKHANKDRCNFSKSILGNQMCYSQTSNMAVKGFPKPMPNWNSSNTFSIQGNPNFLPLDRIKETQEELCSDIRHFPDSSVEGGVPTLNTFNPDQLLESAFSSLRERTIFEW